MPGQGARNVSGTCYAPAPNLQAAYNRGYTVLGRRYAPLRSAAGYDVDGVASWYGWESGTTTSMGTRFNPRALTAASRVLPLPTCVEVTNLRNGRRALVLVNDRGPFVHGRVMDLSYGAAKALGVVGTGTAPVRIVALASGTRLRLRAAPGATPPDVAPPFRAPAPEQSAVAALPAAAAPQTRFPQAAQPPGAPAASDAASDAAIEVTALPPLHSASGPAVAALSRSAAPTGAASAAAAQGGTPTAAAPASAAAPPPASAAAQAEAPLPLEAPQTFVQTGAFTIEGNARLEAARLRRAGIGPVEVVPGFVRGQTWYKVQIGPLPGEGNDPTLRQQLAGLGLRNYTFVEQ